MCLTQLQVGGEYVEVFLAFLKLSVELVFWGNLWALIVTTLLIQLQLQRFQLILGDFTIIAGELETQIELACSVLQLGAAFTV